MTLVGKLGKNQTAIQEGYQQAARYPLIASLPEVEISFRGVAFHLPAKSWISICAEPALQSKPTAGSKKEREPLVTLWPNLRRRASAEDWTYIFARVRLHIALNHLDPQRRDLSWHMASWCRAEQMLATLGIGSRPVEFGPLPEDLPRGDDVALAAFLDEQPMRPEIACLSLAGSGQRFWHFGEHFELSGRLREQRSAALALGIRTAAARALKNPCGSGMSSDTGNKSHTVVRCARDWILSEYPLLAALASSFALVEDEAQCSRLSVTVAAICDVTQEIYVNPRAALTEEEARFVLAHEFLHAGLRHSVRQGERDPWLWNVACDFVINGWLLEMKLGHPPEGIGFLHDPGLRDSSAEEIYEQIVSNLGLLQKLSGGSTLNGENCDILKGEECLGTSRGGGVDLDSFYRRALFDGISRHRDSSRDPLPFGFIKAIGAL